MITVGKRDRAMRIVILLGAAFDFESVLGSIVPVPPHWSVVREVIPVGMSSMSQVGISDMGAHVSCPWIVGLL